MKVLFDTNVLLDVLLARGDFAEPARRLMIFVENAHMRGYLCATTITTIHYLIAKQLGNQAAALPVYSPPELLALIEIDDNG